MTQKKYHKHLTEYIQLVQDKQMYQLCRAGYCDFYENRGYNIKQMSVDVSNYSNEGLGAAVNEALSK